MRRSDRVKAALMCLGAFLLSLTLINQALIRPLRRYLVHNVLPRLHLLSANAVPGDLPIPFMLRFADFVALLLATWVAVRLVRNRMRLPGLLPRGRSLRYTAAGMAGGVGSMSVIIGVQWLLRVYRPGPVVASAPWVSGTLWLIAMFAVAAFEEYQYRSLVRLLLEATVPGFWTAALVTSAWFALMHVSNAGETVAGIVGVFAMGMLLCAIVYRTGSLWAAIGFHAAWNWAESFAFGVADGGGFAQGRLFAPSIDGPGALTGGSAGPEASVVALVVCALLTMVVYKWR